MIKRWLIFSLFFCSYLFPKAGIILENKINKKLIFSIGFLKNESNFFEYNIDPNESLVVNFSKKTDSKIYYKNVNFLIYIETNSYGPVNLSDLELENDYELYLDGDDILEIRPVIDKTKLNMFANKKSIFFTKICKNN